MTITRDMAPAGELCTPDRTIAFPSTIQHWQLRDLLHCPEREHELYCTNRHYTLKGPARPSKHQRPRSFSVNGTSKLSERETAGSTKDASPFTVGRLFTLTTWLLEQEKREVIDSEVAIVISSIALACKQIASLVNRAGISNLTGLAGAANQSGEDQKKLDVVANDVFANCLRSTGRIGTLASEEEDVPVSVEGSYSGDYIVVFDPLDGSSNIDAGGSRVLVQDLHFEPTSLAVRGEIAYKGDCGGSVNNALHFARDASGQVRLFVANNDESIKIFGLPHGRLLASVDCPTSINYCALSPCARHLLAVGDNRGTYLYAARPSGYWQAKSWVEAGDAGMGCAWSPSGSLFAAVSQDGLCCVWDHRSQGVVVRYMTPLACRNVKFAPAPLDLMAFTEHRGRTHLVDMRMWGRHQVLHLGSGPGHDPEISGLAFSPSGQSLYVGLPEGIARFAIDAQSRFSFPAAEVC
ncbi:Fructose-1,6-bisphosphatase, chloroplastic [Auxenochlorella protothecoides]|uniref:Fructose-1,6-bisphosphatase, chloroplastic n=1 Tax=Auxenochlorella protothecoides TaxID=3075 RepID=A0A087SIR7_AUXPR|nr:Fructose-1,6-bisphosphatase, chloroplastic [Auxenochlorella protothecoides]KFM25621.1 Fructose-1,6-bisphosphatase, chloroplastic [Auxenochlorella protothecoides]